MDHQIVVHLTILLAAMVLVGCTAVIAADDIDGTHRDGFERRLLPLSSKMSMAVEFSGVGDSGRFTFVGSKAEKPVEEAEKALLSEAQAKAIVAVLGDENWFLRGFESGLKPGRKPSRWMTITVQIDNEVFFTRELPDRKTFDLIQTLAAALTKTPDHEDVIRHFGMIMKILRGDIERTYYATEAKHATSSKSTEPSVDNGSSKENRSTVDGGVDHASTSAIRGARPPRARPVRPRR